MTNKPKAIGTAAETGVVNFLLSLGYTKAQVKRIVLAGQHDQGDVHLITHDILRVVFEVKGGTAAKTAPRAQVEAWWDEAMAERANAGAPLAVLVTQRGGVSPKRAGEWTAHVDLATLEAILNGSTGRRNREHMVSMRLADLMELIRYGV